MRHIKLPFNLSEYSDLQELLGIPPAVQEWLARAAAIEAQLADDDKSIADHHALIERRKQLWRDEGLIEWMLSLSHDKCWYTEVKHGADYPEIEHFRPKKSARDESGQEVHPGYYWLARIFHERRQVPPNHLI